jgi:iron(III) transport system ATP-binding protein
MTVEQNGAFPLACRRQKGAQAKERARAALALVECAVYGNRLPAALSGGQQQRVALARALVAEPALMLFDEPLSNLDYRLRAQLRQDIRDLHRRLGFTGVYVTHDQTEALQLGTRVAVMKDGRLEQLADPVTVFTHPASPYVARFLGITNTMPIKRSGEDWHVGDEQVMRIDLPRRDLPDSAYDLYVRSSEVQLLPAGSTSLRANDLVRINGGRVVDVLYSGEQSEWVIDVASMTLRAASPARTWPFRRGDLVDVAFDVGAALLYTEGDTPALVSAGNPAQRVHAVS